MSDILTIVGARPQFVKASVVSKALAARGITEDIVHTGQHYDPNMSDLFFEEMEIPKPKFNLGVGSGQHGKQTGRMLEAIEEILLEHKPGMVLLYGDTNSTLAGALAAVKLHFKIAHVEGGLRSHTLTIPEEVNRMMTDHLSNIIFAPTQTAVDNLRHEGIAEDRIVRTGDVMYDAALRFAKKAETESHILEKHGLKPKQYVLVTIHRPSNTDDKVVLDNILGALAELNKQIQVVFPVHPRTAPLVAPYKDKLTIIDAVGYLDMVQLERHSAMIATDSGGVQKEAFFHLVPCVTFFDSTCWVELVESGWNHLAPPHSKESILKTLTRALSDPLPEVVELYGNGHTSEDIAKILDPRASA